VTRTRNRSLSRPAVVIIGGLVVAALVLVGALLLGDGDDEVQAAAATARQRAYRQARVPRLRVPPPTAEVAHLRPRSPSLASAVPALAAAPRDRLAPLLSHYVEFLEDTGIDATDGREVRRILHQAQQSLLRGDQLAAQRLAEPGSPQGRRQRALLDVERELQAVIRPEQVSRVLAHAFVQ
jgi:hypothetical protein